MAASITGTFTIIDRASGPMRKMEHQALRTMAAIEGVGKAQDRQTRSTHKQTNAMTKQSGAAREVENRMKRVETATKRNTRSTDQWSNSVQRLGATLGGLTRIMGLAKFAGMGAGIATLAVAIGQLAGGALALVPALGQAAGAVGAIPQAMMAAAQGAGTLKLAFAGVGDALKQGMAIQQQSAQVAQDVAEAHIQSAHGVQQAEYSLMQSQRGVKDAQVALTQARRDAIRNLTDLKLAALGADLGQKRAAISLREARQQLAIAATSPQTTDLEMQSLQLGVSEAQLGVRQARVDRRRAHVDSARAQSRGVNRNLQVIAATHALTDAVHAQKEATFQLASAQRAQTRELQRGVGPMQGYMTAMRNLSPPARAFVRHVISLRPQLQRLKAAAAGGLFPGLGRSLDHAVTMFPMLERVVARTGRVMGNEADRAARRFTTPGRQADLEGLGNANAKIIGRMMRGASNLGSALLDFMVAAKPFTNWLSRVLLTGTRLVANWSRAQRENGKFAEGLRHTRARLTQFWDMAKNVASVLRALLRAATPLGDRLWKGMDRATRGWKRFTDSTGGRSKMRHFFDSLYPGIAAMAKLTADLAVAWAHITVNRGFATTVSTLDKYVPDLERLFVSGAGLGPQLADVLGQLVRLVADLPVSTLGVFLDALSRVLGMIDWILQKVPGAKNLLAGLLITAALGKSIGLVGALTGKWRNLFSLWRRAPVPPASPGTGLTAGSPLAGGVGGRVGSTTGRFGRLRAGIRGNAGAIGVIGGTVVGTAVGGQTGSMIGGALGGAGLGAEIGTAIAPGIGTAIGAALGGIGGLLLGRGGGAAKPDGNQAAAMMAGRGMPSVHRQIGHLSRMLHAPVHDAYTFDAQGFPVQHKGTNLTGDRRKQAEIELRALRAYDKQIAADRNRRLAEESRQHGETLAVGFGRAYRVYAKKYGPEKGMQETSRQMLGTIGKLKPQGRLAMAQNVLSWGNEVARKNPKLQGVVNDMRAGIIAKFHRLGQDIKIVNGQILTGSTSEWGRIAKAMTDPAEKARQQVTDAFTSMQQKAVGSLQAMGYSKSQAQKIIQGLESGNTAAKQDAGRGPIQNFRPSQVGSAQHAGQLAHGGRIPGVGTRDTVAVAPGHMAAPGELIVNRHTEKRVNAALSAFGTSLGAQVAGERRPHYAATGMRVGGVGGGVTPAVANLISRLDGMGFHHGSTTGGVHAPGSYHYRGMAVDYGNASNDMRRLWRVVYPERKRFAELFGPSGLRGPTLMHYGQGFSDPLLQSQHNDHIHLALADAAARAGNFHLSTIGLGGARAIRAPRANTAGMPGMMASAAMGAIAAGLNQRIGAGDIGGGGGTQGGSLNSWLTRALRITGHYSRANLAGLRRMAMGESSGDPHAVQQITDVNSGNGGRNLARGLLQTIPATFNSYKLPGHGNIFDPVDNTIASIRYQFARYGHIVGHPGYSLGGRMPEWGGWHAKGGSFNVTKPTIFGAGEAGPERVNISSSRTGGGRAPIHVSIGHIAYHREGDIADAIRKEMSMLADDLDLVGSQED